MFKTTKDGSNGSESKLTSLSNSFRSKKIFQEKNIRLTELQNRTTNNPYKFSLTKVVPFMPYSTKKV